MATSISRAVVRRVQTLRSYARSASTTTEVSNAASSAKEKTQEVASSAVSKASQGLSKVSDSAGPAMGRAANAAGQALNSIGGRTGQMISFAQSLVPPTIYYSRVGMEFTKLVAHGRKMSPPDMATFQSYFQPMMNAVRTPSTLLDATSSSAHALNPTKMMDRIRNMDRQQMISGGIVAAEVLGFFTVGEMIGRWKFVGYNTSGHAHGGDHH